MLATDHLHEMVEQHVAAVEFVVWSIERPSASEPERRFAQEKRSGYACGWGRTQGDQKRRRAGYLRTGNPFPANVAGHCRDHATRRTKMQRR